MPKEVVLRNKGRKSGAGIKANLLHCLSSLMSPQSFQPSHFNFWSMHRPLVQANRSGQAYPITHRKHGWVGGYSDKLNKTELCIFTRRVMLPMLAPVDQSINNEQLRLTSSQLPSNNMVTVQSHSRHHHFVTDISLITQHVV